MNLPQENIYGHTKKLKYIIHTINEQIRAKGKSITVLDYGCGNAEAVSQYIISDELMYYGVDVHEASLSYARKHFEKENTVFLSHVPESVQFDVIVYADVLEHLDNPVSVLQHHYRLLKEDGIIIGAVPNKYGAFEMEQKIDKWLKLSEALMLAKRLKRRLLGPGLGDSQIPYNDESGHIHFFTRKTLISTLEQAGYVIDSLRNGAFWAAPLSGWLCLRRDKIVQLNASIADHLPYWAVSTWYFSAKKSRQKK
jgi:SAM-dependent methyltransferase